MKTRPWPEWRNGKPITVRQLAKLMAPHEIAPKTIRTTSGTAKGYLFSMFDDAFSRYLPPTDPSHRNNPQETGIFGESYPPQGAADVADRKSQDPNEPATCGGVADENGGSGEEGPYEVEI